MAVYYNEIDKYCVQWLKNLIDAGHLPAGDVDDRPIQEVKGKDLEWYEQAHFFAGVGGWPLALRLAGWPESRPVWTGSCPCQPFSAAGKRRGTADARHLWPEFNRLIAECKPPTVFGEQVASKDGRLWLSRVRSDLEALGYGVGAADLCAAGVGAPHIRQRLWWVAQSHQGQRGWLPDREGGDGDGQETGWVEGDGEPQSGRADGGGVAHPQRNPGDPRGVAGQHGEGHGETGARPHSESGRPSHLDSWSPSILLPCLDGKARRVESTAQQMAYGISYCLGRLRPEQEEEIEHAALTTGLGAEVLRALQGGYDPAQVWQALGGRIGFPKTTLLFSCLCQHSRELGKVLDGTPQGIPQERQEGMRTVRMGQSPARASSGWEPSQQCSVKFADAVHSLSLEWSSLASFTGHPLALGVPGRVGRLRAYGNAIVPQVAAEFVRAFMGTEGT